MGPLSDNQVQRDRGQYRGAKRGGDDQKHGPSNWFLLGVHGVYRQPCCHENRRQNADRKLLHDDQRNEHQRDDGKKTDAETLVAYKIHFLPPCR